MCRHNTKGLLTAQISANPKDLGELFQKFGVLLHFGVVSAALETGIQINAGGFGLSLSDHLLNLYQLSLTYPTGTADL